MIRSLDRAALGKQFCEAKPFPFVVIDDFLDFDFAREAAAAYPRFGKAARVGRRCDSVNERRNLQVSDATKFPAAVRELSEALAAPDFVADLAAITGVPDLIVDPHLTGGGMHHTGPGGRTDVHVDGNYLEQEQLFRRIEILVYLNSAWADAWGGRLELWDHKVKTCHHSIAPILARCVILETSDTSFHGVSPLTAPPGLVRRSFAAYYYTREAPAGFAGVRPGPRFRARPTEKLKGWLLMPADDLKRRLTGRAR